MATQVVTFEKSAAAIIFVHKLAFMMLVDEHAIVRS
jgi:hypothetical protein